MVNTQAHAHAHTYTHTHARAHMHAQAKHLYAQNKNAERIKPKERHQHKRVYSIREAPSQVISSLCLKVFEAAGVKRSRQPASQAGFCVVLMSLLAAVVLSGGSHCSP